MAIDYQGIGSRIREKRKQKGWSQAELAEASGIESSNISHIERAATKLSLPTLISIANALESTLDELVYDSLVQSAPISCDRINALLSDCTPSELKSLAQILETTKTVLRNN